MILSPVSESGRNAAIYKGKATIPFSPAACAKNRSTKKDAVFITKYNEYGNTNEICMFFQQDKGEI